MDYLKKFILYIKNRLFIFFPVVLVLIIIYLVFLNPSYNHEVNAETFHYNNEEKIEAQKFKYGFILSDYNYMEGAVKKGESIYFILDSLGISLDAINGIIRNTGSLFDFTQVRPKKNYMLLCSNDTSNTPLYFVYEKSAIEYVIFDINDTKNMHIGKRNVDQRVLAFSAKIKSSLWNAILEQKQSPSIAVKLEEVYRWSIDFFGIQKDDHFKLIYKQDFVEGKPIGYITPLAACFNHRKKDYYAFYFKDEVTNHAGFYNEKGYNVQKSFLKAPLTFTRVSSRFTNSRYHPLLRIYRPHHGVDYAAPKGTPVYAVSNGKIIKKGYQRRGGGLYIKIKHDKSITTVYMHLSRFAKNTYLGKKVKQGQLIGYVGSTGISTGPHLDFRIYKKGKPVNPLKFVSPNAKPIKKKNLAQFEILKDSLMQELDAISIAPYEEKDENDEKDKKNFTIAATL